MMDLEVLDHVVIASQGFVSLKDKRLGFDAESSGLKVH